MTDRIPGAPGQYKAVVTEAELQKMQAGEQFTITMTRDDQPITEGTPYSKAAVLPDALAVKLCPDITDPTPADAFQALHDRIYPVGAIYLSVSDADPAALFGGTWERLKDTFLLAAGDSYTPGTTGGEAAHKLTVEEMPAHTHSVFTKYQNNDSGADSAIRGVADYDKSNWWTYDYTSATESTGGNTAHNNMPPYLAVYAWKRVA